MLPNWGSKVRHQNPTASMLDNIAAFNPRHFRFELCKEQSD